MPKLGGFFKLGGSGSGGSGGSGTVTSVAATVPSGFSVSGSPITDDGTLAITLDAQSGNKVLASPSNGSSGTPGFRVLVNADIPSSIDATKIADGSVSNSEFQYLGGVTSDIQTQLGTKFSLQTETSFTDNETPVIFLKSPEDNEDTPFLKFVDFSDTEIVSIAAEGEANFNGTVVGYGNIRTPVGGGALGLKPEGYGFDIIKTGSIKLTSGEVSTSGIPDSFLDFSVAPEHTGILLESEYPAFWKNGSPTYTWTAGDVTNQRFFKITRPSIAATGTSVFTNAATLSVSGPPNAGTNVTITNPYAFWVESGASKFAGRVTAEDVFSDIGYFISKDSGGINLGTDISSSIYYWKLRPEGGIVLNTALASTTGVPPSFLDFAGAPAHTGITASTEYKSFWSNPSQTYTWATGALTTNRFFHITAPTMAFSGASTVTKAATLAVSGAPTAGTNATITNPYALWVESGLSQFDGNVSLGSSNVLLLGGATSPAGSAVKLQIGTPATTNNAVSLYIEPVAAGYSAIAIQAQPSQSLDLLQVVNSSGTKIAAIGNRGSLWSNPGGALSTLVLGDGAGAALTSGLTNNTIVGSYAGAALTTGTGNVFIGNNVGYSDSNISNCIIIGSSECDASNTSTNGPFLAIGVAGGDDIVSPNVAVFGSSTVPYNDWYFGRGYSGSTVSDITFQPTIATGADKAGADFFIRGGAGTGDGEPGTIQFQATSILASGSTAQTQSTIATITYGGLQVNAGTLQSPKFKGSSSTPSVTAGAGAGSGASASLTTGSTDTAGEVVITTGTTTASGSFVTLTFSSAYGTAPFVQLTPSNSATASIGTDFDVWHYVTATTTTFVISLNGAVADATEYRFMYHVIQ